MKRNLQSHWWASAVIGLLFLPATARAQAHPCDETPPAEYRVKKEEPVVPGWCHDGKDDEGLPIVLLGFRLKVTTPAGVEVHDVGLPAPLTPPNTAGFVYYESAPMAFSTSASVAVTAYSPDGDGLYSTPIIVRAFGLPRAPKGLRTQ